MYKEEYFNHVNNKKDETGLHKMKKGEAGIVKRLLTGESKNLQKLLAMGIVPGRVIQIIQTYPVFILQIDHTQAAMDEELAEQIIMTV
ncbi:MAG: ferrous iron transport protein A [Bacteroidales bacterium]|nr:ferrous iron transport protein A [Bacteroidales bacterium]